MKGFVVVSALVALCSFSLLGGCDLHVTVVHQPGQQVAVAAEPEVIQEDAAFDGEVFVRPAVIEEYVQVRGEWHYWHPGYNCWVRVNRGYGWHPPEGYRHSEYRSLREHPTHGNSGPARHKGHAPTKKEKEKHEKH